MTSSGLELLLRIDREGPSSLVSQVRSALRDAIRKGSLRAGVRLPSTRAFAGELGVSRPVIVDAYAQLAAEGYLRLRRRASRWSRRSRAPARRAPAADCAAAPADRLDMRPNLPDLAMFPRSDWLRALRVALNGMTPDELGYEDRHGTERLRQALADYLGRVRGVVTEPAQIVITSGFAEARALTCEVLRAQGVERPAVEDPSYASWLGVDEAGLMRIPVPVDAPASTRSRSKPRTPRPCS